MACCSPPPSFSSPHRQQKGSQRPIRCAGGGFLPVISDEPRYAKGDLLRQSEPGKLAAIAYRYQVLGRTVSTCDICWRDTFA
ncbi:unnamed protein product [Pleuronectes platessa]|uniref:Uncharacterized protein n=1 Tax=Pleuronectes platessa TaxID=8262 RepID=A0A9N7TPE7_PLEPL|nr:unnamed protein product [Pleuronectes platessa]